MMISHMYVFLCMCSYVCRPGYMLVCLYIAGSKYRRERANDTIWIIERAMVELENNEGEEDRCQRHEIW